jgi:hypothetical protein
MTSWALQSAELAKHAAVSIAWRGGNNGFDRVGKRR